MISSSYSFVFHNPRFFSSPSTLFSDPQGYQVPPATPNRIFDPQILKETLLTDIKNSMRFKDKVRLSVLRNFQSLLKNKEIEDSSSELSSDKIQAVFKRQKKKHAQSIKSFSIASARRDDLIAQEEEELRILTEFEEQVGKLVE